MAKSPGVVMERSGGQVRLTGLKWALPVTIDTEKKQFKATIQPNRWTTVPDEIYQFLKARFENPRHTAVPDVNENERNPHAPGDVPAMTTEEVDPQFYLQFR
jgi:hypothetical protein